MVNKTDLRIRFKSARKELDIQNVSRNIEKNLRAFEIYKNSKNVMLFYPLKFEINLLGLLEDKGKNFYFPKVDGEKLIVCPYTKDTKFKKSALNVSEPCSEPVDAEILDLIIIPALAVDKDNYRLGYGGGYYDRFLKLVPDAVTVVPVCEKFVVEKLPHEEFDIPVDYVITDAEKGPHICGPLNG